MRCVVALVFGLGILVFNSCGPSDLSRTSDVLPLTAAQARADFKTLTDLVEGYYAPLEYKLKRFGDSMEAESLSDLRRQGMRELRRAQGDAEAFGVFARLLAKFHDGHVSISFPTNSSGITEHFIPIELTAIEGKAFVFSIGDDDIHKLGISVGDQILSVDGKDPMTDLLPIITRYESFGNPRTDKYLVRHAFHRPFYMTELIPSPSQPAKITYLKPDGDAQSPEHIELTWRTKTVFPGSVQKNSGPGETSSALFTSYHSPRAVEASAEEGSAINFGTYDPWFWTDKVQAQRDIADAPASEAKASKYSALTTDFFTPPFSKIYEYGGKKILLIRQQTYMISNPDNRLKQFRAILDSWDEIADVLVLDQTNNPGGNVSYGLNFASLFLQKPGPGPVQRYHIDRSTYSLMQNIAKSETNAENGRVWQRYIQALEAGARSQQALTDFLPMFSESTEIKPDKGYTWKKPVLMLVDELTGSCGDLVPMVLKENGAAKLFGSATAGWGGHVEEVGTLTYSRATVRLTRGLFAPYKESGQYAPSDLIENNGVAVDYGQEKTIEDFRAGWVGYFNAFSKVAVELAEKATVTAGKI